jgi:hypothetical protein
MTGPPAFGPTHGDDEIWAIVAFVRHLPHLSGEGAALQPAEEEGHHPHDDESSRASVSPFGVESGEPRSGRTQGEPMRMTRILALAAVTAFASATAHAADATGKWKAEFDTQVGTQKYTYDLKVDGESLTGTAHFERMGQTGDAELKEGKVKGDEISFVEMLDFGGNEVRIEYTGKVAGDEIKFTRKVGDFASEEFTATRAKD